jgi:hypothetical protein
MLNKRESGSDMELLNMRCALAALDVELKLCRLIYLLKYSPSQPRAPAGSPEGGQWTSGGGGGGTEQGSEADAGSSEEGRSARVRVVNRRGHTQSTLRRRSAAAGTPPKGMWQRAKHISKPRCNSSPKIG